MENLFNLKANPTRAEVADAVTAYVTGPRSPEEDHHIKKFLEDSGYRSEANSDPEMMYGSGSPKDQAAFKLIGEIIDNLHKGSPVRDEAIANLRLYADSKNRFNYV